MTVRAIIYKGELYDEFNTAELNEWENALDAVVGNTKAERDLSTEWITYDFLMERGYFVQAPDAPRPNPNPSESNVPVIPPNAPLATIGRQPLQTQADLLREKERLLRMREQLITAREKLQREKIQHQRERNARPRPSQIYQTSESSVAGAFYFAVGIFAIIVSLVVFGILVMTQAKIR